MTDLPNHSPGPLPGSSPRIVARAGALAAHLAIWSALGFGTCLTLAHL